MFSGRFVAIVFVLLPGTVGFAQVGPLVERRAALLQIVPGPRFGGTIVTADRRVVRSLDRAAELIEAENWADAVTLLQAVIDHGGDAFYQPEDKPKSLFRSVKSEATRLIGSIPRDARRNTYDLEFGPVARTLLDEAAGDPEKLAAVARRFLHTEAGAEAQYRVGLWHMDHGRWLAASTCLDRLAELPDASDTYEPLLSLRRHATYVAAGDTERAEALAKQITERFGDREIRIAGTAYQLDGDRSILAFFRDRFAAPEADTAIADDWTTGRGGPRRSGLVSLVEGEAKAWSSSTIVDPFREDPTDESPTPLTRAIENAIDGLPTGGLPAGQPVVVGDRLVVRTVANVRVVDLASGDVVTETFPERAVEELGGFDNEVIAANGELPSYVRQRVADDATQGSFSADGRRAYVVEDVGRYAKPSRESRLVAYDLETGRTDWMVGGPPGDFAAPLAGTFFLGPPLPLAGRLYAIAEVDNEVRLIVLEPRTERGRERVEVVWSQPLAAPNLDLTAAPHRRTTGLVVTHADGILVCPTGTGIYVAVDVSNQTLLWARKFEPNAGLPVVPLPGPIPAPPQPNARTDWQDDVVVATGDRVLLTPKLTNALHCVDLRTGRDLWEKPVKREDGLYLAGARDGRVVVVGTKNVRSIDLETGKPSWKASATPGSPAGRGFVTETHAVLPVDTNEIAFVELASGRVTTKRAIPKGVDVGNLVPAGDRIVSQGTKSLDVFAVELPAAE